MFKSRARDEVMFCYCTGSTASFRVWSYHIHTDPVSCRVRCHIIIELPSTKELRESSGYERLNEWHPSPLHAADLFPTCCYHSCSMSTIRNLTPPLPITLLAGSSGQPPNSQRGISSNIPNPFPIPLNREGSRIKHDTLEDPGGLNLNLTPPTTGKTFRLIPWNSSKLDHYILESSWSLRPFLSLRFGNVQVFWILDIYITWLCKVIYFENFGSNEILKIIWNLCRDCIYYSDLPILLFCCQIHRSLWKQNSDEIRGKEGIKIMSHSFLLKLKPMAGTTVKIRFPWSL